MVTGRQIREGRALAGLSQAELAAAAEVALGLIVRIEVVDDSAMAKKPDLAAIRRVLKAAGVEFTAAGQAGVMLRKGDA